MEYSTTAIFLDKDGTLLQNVPDNVDERFMEFTPAAGQALQLWHAAGYRLVVVSNQSGVARGRFREEGLQRVARRLEEMFAAEEVPLAGCYFCPHHPDGSVSRYAVSCGCRKPRPGMLLQAARELNLDLESSWMVGDILDDVEAGQRAGCRTVLIDNGGETLWHYTPLRTPSVRVPDLFQAAQYILFSPESLGSPASAAEEVRR